MAESTCERCGAPLPAGAQFCPVCGMPVASADRPGEERKVVTVLFADLAGSTELAATLDPERVREVMGTFFRMAQDEVSSLRGRTEKFVGDAVMAVFGLPHAHDDDALRAVRAGLSIRDRVGRLGEKLTLSVPLEVRVGVNTGPVAAATALAGEFLVSGAPVNLAARLQQAAERGEVLVGDMTWQLTQHAAEFGPPRSVEARGFDHRVAGYPVVALSARSTRRTIPLVGRKRELALLVDAFERSRETSRAHLVTIVGEPGIGKSRLVDEFVAGVPEGTEVLFGRASEFGEDVAFAPLADLLRRRLGIEPDTGPEEARALLEERLREIVDPSDVDETAARLGLVLDLGETPRESQYRAAEIRAGLSSMLAGLARDHPVVIVLDDLHLARRALLEVLEGLIQHGRRLPLTLVVAGREDLLRNRSEWGSGGHDSLVLRLDTLRTEEATQLAQAAGEPLDEAAARRIADHAGGNPFFIVETTGMLLHERSETPHAASIEHLLPPTVQAVVASRIDHLPDRARNLFRVASVFPGNAFHESKLALVTTVDPEALRILYEEELIVPDEERAGRWRFRHELLREVAYESVTKRERRRLHERVAEGLEETEPSEKHVQQIAYHLEEAALAALDLDPADRAPADRAGYALRLAGDFARRRMELPAAIDLYERALHLAGSEDGWGDRQARVLAGIGEARYWLGEYESAERVLEQALEVGGPDPWTRAMALRFLGDIALNFGGDPDKAAKEFDEALDAARELGDPWALARTMLMAGWVPYWREDFEGARRIFEDALRIARENPERDTWAEARALNSIAGVATAMGGATTEVLSLADEALRIGRETGDPFTVAVAQERVSGTLRRMWRLDEALAGSDEAIRIYRELGSRWELASALGDRGTIHRLTGRLEEAEADLREAYEVCIDLGERALVLWTASELAYVLLLKGEVAEARGILDDPALPADVKDPGSQTSILSVRSVLARAEGDEEEARRLAAETVERDRKRGLRTWEAARVWWAGSLFGADLVGGDGALEKARQHLQEAEWLQALKEPELAGTVAQRTA